jgi:small-conductance mechanosensitive channel
MKFFSALVSGHDKPWCRLYCRALGISLFLLWAGWAGAVEPKAGAAEPVAGPPPLLPIPLADIPTRATAERTSLEQAEVLLARSSVFDEIESDLLDRERVITRDLVSLGPSLAAASSREAIAEIGKKWLDLNHSLDDSETELQKRTGVIQLETGRLDVSRGVWELTVKEAQNARAPDEVVNLARAVANDVTRVYQSLRDIQDRALALQAKVGRARGVVQESLGRVSTEEANLVNNLIHRERPPLWDEAVVGTTLAGLADKARGELGKWISSIQSVFQSQYDRLGFQIFLLLVLTMILRRSRVSARALVKADPLIAKGMSVFERPFALALLLVLMSTPWFYPYAPPALADAVGLLLVFPVLALVLPLLESSARPALILLAILYVVDQVRDLLDAAPLVARLVFILEIVVAIGIILWIIRSKAWRHDDNKKQADHWQVIIQFGLNSALLLLVVAALTAVSGYVRLAVLIGSGVLNSIYLALLLAALERTAGSIVRLALRSRAAQALNMVKKRTRQLGRGFIYVFRVLVVAAWVLVVLDFFALQDYVLGFIKGIVFAKFHAGAVDVSFADVLAFGLTITAAILLARFIVLVLDEDVYPRVEMGRGVSFAISSVIKYGIILIGFLVAAGAMGIGMDRITILLGALGVGLGFGLQTIVNNFVSGMILVFERPVQIGDSVEIGSVKGKITRIGIRSSTVRSFDGADITVPNGSLLSDALTNWTLTDRNRRIDITVGVAYGTSPDTVIEALHSTLDGQEGLLKEPAPQVVFDGFGDNSLDFILRAWVSDNDQYVTTRSQIALAVNRALKERGIEIPYPQRDIHLRSVAPDVSFQGST